MGENPPIPAAVYHEPTWGERMDRRIRESRGCMMGRRGVGWVQPTVVAEQRVTTATLRMQREQVA